VVRSEWDIRFVRGPLSARVLGLGPGSSLSDSALLVAGHVAAGTRSASSVGFLPHVFSARTLDCARACEAAGLQFIDPRWRVDRILQAVTSVDRLIAEALHGAIVADALGVPWMRVKALGWRYESRRIADFKWADWAQSVGVRHDASFEVGIPWRMGRGARLVNGLLSRLQVRTLAFVLRKAAASADFQLSSAGCRHELRQRMLERIHEAVGRNADAGWRCAEAERSPERDGGG
jgi:hypothetical protein